MSNRLLSKRLDGARLSASEKYYCNDSIDTWRKSVSTPMLSCAVSSSQSAPIQSHAQPICTIPRPMWQRWVQPLVVSKLVPIIQQSTLLNIPAEIRAMIWEWVFFQRISIEDFHCGFRRLWTRSPRGFASALDIVRVCKLFYKESVGDNLILKHVCFQAHVNNYSRVEDIVILSRLRVRGLLENIEIRITFEDKWSDLDLKWQRQLERLRWFNKLKQLRIIIVQQVPESEDGCYEDYSSCLISSKRSCSLPEYIPNQFLLPDSVLDLLQKSKGLQSLKGLNHFDMCIQFRADSQILSWWQSKYPRDLQNVLEEKMHPYTKEDIRYLGNYHITIRSTNFRPEESKRYFEVEEELREKMTGKRQGCCEVTDYVKYKCFNSVAAPIRKPATPVNPK